MTLSRTISATARRGAALTHFNAGARSFVPGKQWMKPKKLTWDPIGVTSVKYFNYKKGAQSRMRGDASALKGPPGSSIKDSDPKAAQPFLIPKLYTAEKIHKKKISKKKLKEHGYPVVNIEDMDIKDMDIKDMDNKDMYPEVTHEESETVKQLRKVYKDYQEFCSGTPILARTQPNRFNYCDN